MQLTEEQRKAIEAQKEQCPFCQILAGKIPAKKVYEDDLIVAILDINPASSGHLLVMPKEHYPIMPLIPPDTFSHLFKYVREMSKYARDAVVSAKSTVFIANGQAAGQQASHFLLHIIPSPSIMQQFVLPVSDLDEQKVSQAAQSLGPRLNQQMASRSQLFQKQVEDSSSDLSAMPEGIPSDLAVLIQENPGFREMIIRKPGAVIEGLKDNPSLQPLFEGIDVFELSKQLKTMFAVNTMPIPVEDTVAVNASEPEVPSVPKPASLVEPVPEPEPVQSSSEQPAPISDTPSASSLSDIDFLSFLQEKERLRDLLLNDLDTLKVALEQQPKLQAFFAGSSPEQVRDRYVQIVEGQQSRLPQNDSSSLDDLAGGL